MDLTFKSWLQTHRREGPVLVRYAWDNSARGFCLSRTFFDSRQLQSPINSFYISNAVLELCFFSVTTPCKSTLVVVLVTQLCSTLCDPMNCSLPGPSAHGTLKARMLQWVAILFTRGSFQPRGWTWVSCTAGRFFTIWATREVPILPQKINKLTFFPSPKFHVPCMAPRHRGAMTCFSQLLGPSLVSPRAPSESQVHPFLSNHTSTSKTL